MSIMRSVSNIAKRVEHLERFRSPIGPGGSGMTIHDIDGIWHNPLDTTNFNAILSAVDNDVQKALDTLDDHLHNALYWQMNKIILMSSATWTPYAKTGAGFTAALAAAVVGDTIWLPPATYTDILGVPFTIPSGVSVVAEEKDNTVIACSVVMEKNTAISNITIRMALDSEDIAKGISTGATEGVVLIDNCNVYVDNVDDGEVSGIFISAEYANIYIHDTIVSTSSLGTCIALNVTSVLEAPPVIWCDNSSFTGTTYDIYTTVPIYCSACVYRQEYLNFECVADTCLVPLSGDKAAWEIATYENSHASDIYNDALLRHLPLPGDAGSFAESDGTNWQSVNYSTSQAFSDFKASEDGAPVTLDVNAQTLLTLTAQEIGLADQAASVVLVGPEIGQPAGTPTLRQLEAQEVVFTPAGTIEATDVQFAIAELDEDFSNHIGDANAHHDAMSIDSDADTLLSLSTQSLGLDTQVANMIFAGPASGAAAVPTFRALVAADLPASTEAAQGAAELATTAEVQTGTDTTRIVTPAGLRADVPTTPAASRGVRLDANGDALLPAGGDVLPDGATDVDHGIDKRLRNVSGPVGVGDYGYNVFQRVVPGAGYLGLLDGSGYDDFFRINDGAGGSLAIWSAVAGCTPANFFINTVSVGYLQSGNAASATPNHAIETATISGHAANDSYTMHGMISEFTINSRVGFVLMSSDLKTGAAWWIVYTLASNTIRIEAATYSSANAWLGVAGDKTSSAAYTRDWTSRFTGTETAVENTIRTPYTLRIRPRATTTQLTVRGAFYMQYVTAAPAVVFTPTSLYIFTEGNLVTAQPALLVDLIGRSTE